MSSSRAEQRRPEALNVVVTDDTLTVDLADGRTLSVPIAWYPRLAHGTTSERRNWSVIGRGEGIHWSELDEDVSVEALLAGKASAESHVSFVEWLRSRPRGD
jgi:hypothetical protein